MTQWNQGSPAAAIDPAIVDQAIAWSVRLRLHVAKAAELQSFHTWRNADPLHEAAWRRIEIMQQDLGALSSALSPQVTAQVLAVSAQEARARKGRRQALKLVLTGMVVGSGLYASRNTALVQATLADYSTGVGRSRTVQLADGTELLLNTDTAVNVRYEADRRLIELKRGEIMITTGSDAGVPQRRPFMVATAHGVMLVKGTRFLVHKESLRTQLTVLEHAVEIHAAATNMTDGAGEPLLVQAGESYYISAGQVWRADTAQLDPAGWTEGLIVAREMRMDRFLAELSRYRHGVLSCDEAVAALPVSGIFQLRDIDRTLEVLLATQPVAALYRTRYWVTIIARPPEVSGSAV